MIWIWDRAQILCTNNLFTLYSEAYAPPTQNTRTKSFITIINRRHWLRLLEIPHKTLLEFFLFRSFRFFLSQGGRLEFATTSDIRESLLKVSSSANPQWFSQIWRSFQGPRKRRRSCWRKYCFPDEGSLVCPPRKSMIFYQSGPPNIWLPAPPLQATVPKQISPFKGMRCVVLSKKCAKGL